MATQPDAPVVSRTKDWGGAFLLLGGITLVFTVAFAAAQVLLAQASERNYPFSGMVEPGLIAATVALVAGGVLYILGSRGASRKEPSDAP